MSKYISQGPRALKHKLDSRVNPKTKEIAKESTELNEDDLGHVVGGGAVGQAGWNIAQNKRVA